MNGYWDELADFMRGLFNFTFKTNPFLERAVMTGVTRISKESIFSELNNLIVVTASTRLYETAFGFTGRRSVCSVRRVCTTGSNAAGKKLV